MKGELHLLMTIGSGHSPCTNVTFYFKNSLSHDSFRQSFTCPWLDLRDKQVYQTRQRYNYWYLESGRLILKLVSVLLFISFSPFAILNTPYWYWIRISKYQYPRSISPRLHTLNHLVTWIISSEIISQVLWWRLWSLWIFLLMKLAFFGKLTLNGSARVPSKNNTCDAKTWEPLVLDQSCISIQNPQFASLVWHRLEHHLFYILWNSMFEVQKGDTNCKIDKLIGPSILATIIKQDYSTPEATGLNTVGNFVAVTWVTLFLKGSASDSPLVVQPGRAFLSKEFSSTK